MKEDSELVKIIKKSDVPDSVVASLQNSFAPFYKEASDMQKEAKELIVSDENDVDGMKRARELRLKLKGIRVEAEKTRKDLKNESLRTGKAIDGIANVLKFLIVPLEEHLEGQEKFKELLEKKRLEELEGKRESELSKYVSEESLSFYNLGEMSNDAFNNLLETSRKAYEAEQQAIKKAEEDRIAEEKKEREEQERIRIENEKLKKKLEKEELEKGALLKEMRTKQEKEEKVAKEEAEQKRKDDLAPDLEKLSKLARRLSEFDIPTVSGKEAQKVVEHVSKTLGELSFFIGKKLEV